MANQEIHGYILHRRSYRETSFLVDVFSVELGKCRFVARGVRSPKSDRKSVLQPFQYVQCELSGKGELKNLVRAEILEKPHQLTAQRLFCGMYVNEDSVRNQMEGAAIFGMSLTMFGKISTKDGAVEQSNFHDYQMTRMKDAPNIHIQLIDSDEAPTGVGEPGVPPMAAAITNAIFNATGKRIRTLPLSEHGMV